MIEHTVRIGNRTLGNDHPCFIVAEIGINHNGNLEIAKKLIDIACEAGCDAVKFQKRDPESSVPDHMRNVMRETPWGLLSYLEYKRKIELGLREYSAIDSYCRKKKIMWFVSFWDEVSFETMERFDLPAYKIPSAKLNDGELIRLVRGGGSPVILSTGMSLIGDIDKAVKILNRRKCVLMQATSAYPCPNEEVNLSMIKILRDRYHTLVGYSGHELGIQISVAAKALGACCIERHITLDRAMWGSDQSASLEPQGIKRLVRDIRIIEQAMGDGIKRLEPSEKTVLQRLRPRV